jgi:hypothetical protein
MLAGHALSCFMLRQMEYDADRYETRLAGAEAFVETSRRMLLLDLASSGAFRVVVGSWNKAEKLPDDLATLVLGIAEKFPADEFQKIETALAQNRTGYFDTHPAHGDRLASARRENAAGAFQLDGPATQLFKDFPRTSRAVTLDYYRQVIGKHVRREALVPAASLLTDARVTAGAGKG